MADGREGTLALILRDTHPENLFPQGSSNWVYTLEPPSRDRLKEVRGRVRRTEEPLPPTFLSSFPSPF